MLFAPEALIIRRLSKRELSSPYSQDAKIGDY